jgi:thiol:disulfide interchange protein
MRMRAKNWVIFAALLALVALSYRPRRGPTAFVDLSFDAAERKAGTEGKLVMIDFFATWCGPCQMLDRDTWPDADVRRLMAERTVPIKVDAEKETALAARYGVEAYPTVLFVRADGVEVGRLVGFRSADDFLAAAREILGAPHAATQP